jgi:hypothetical protein
MRAVNLARLGYLVCRYVQEMRVVGSLQFSLGLLDMGIGGGAGPAPPSFVCRLLFFGGGGGGAGFFFAAAAAPAGDGITPVCWPAYERAALACGF